MKVLGAAVRWGSRYAALLVLVIMLTLNVVTASFAGAAGLVTTGLALFGVETVLSIVQDKLAASDAELKTKRGSLAQVEGELERANADRARGKQQLEGAQADLKIASDQLEKKDAELRDARAKVSELKTRLARSEGKVDKHRAAVRRLTSRIAKRTELGAVRNIGSMLAEAVPFYGVAVIVGVTGWEIADACMTMQDMEELNQAFGISDPQVDRSKVCGLTVPTVEEVKDKLPTFWE